MTNDFKFTSISRRLILLLIVVGSALSVSGQTEFRLIREIGGRCSFNAPINGCENDAKFMLSSAHEMVMGSELYDKTFKNTEMELRTVRKTEFNINDKAYKINKVVTGKVRIGDAIFKGSIFVLDGYEDVSVPIHLLQNGVDSTKNIIKMNFKKGELSFVGIEDVDTASMQQFALKKINGMPAINTTVTVEDIDGHWGRVSGAFLVKFGSVPLLALLKKNLTVREMLKTSKIEIGTANTRKGKVVGRGIFAEKCVIGNSEFINAAVVLSDKFSKQFVGIIGLKFFAGDVYLDRNKGRLYRERTIKHAVTDVNQ